MNEVFEAMAMFKMFRGALPAAAVETARSLAERVSRRTGTEKFSIASEWTNPEERRVGLDVVSAFLNGPAAAAFRDRFGVEPSVCLNITTIRHQTSQGREKPVGWHLDLGFVGDDAPFLVSWTTLQDVGTSRPGLDVCVPVAGVLDMSRFMTEWHRRLSRGESMEFEDRQLDDCLGSDAWVSRPTHARAGDAAVFDQFVLHRTQLLADGYAERHSFEFRMMHAENLPSVQRSQPVVLVRREADGELGITVAADGRQRPMSVERFANAEFRSASSSYT